MPLDYRLTVSAFDACNCLPDVQGFKTNAMPSKRKKHKASQVRVVKVVRSVKALARLPAASAAINLAVIVLILEQRGAFHLGTHSRREEIFMKADGELKA